MKYEATVLGLLLALLAVLPSHSIGQTQTEDDQPIEEGLIIKRQLQKGAGLYEKYCAFCHGKQGEGYLADEANALGNQDFLKSATDEFIVEGIVRGRPGTPMSAWGRDQGGVLVEDDVLAIVAFIRGWQVEESVDLGKVRVEGNAENGRKIYLKWCGVCHGQEGEGGTALSLNNPVFQQTASDGFIRYAVEKGRRQTSMPAFKKHLFSKEIDDVVAFIRTMKPTSKQTSVSPDTAVAFSPESLKHALLNPGNTPAEFSPVDGRYVPADVVYEAYKGKKAFVILDARPRNDYLKAHIEGAISVPFYEVENTLGHLPKDHWIITYCVCPHAMSGKALDKLRENGFEKTAILDEGFNVWRERGYPVQSP
jgi:cytochrome c oxidase cbb3-type subunit 3